MARSSAEIKREIEKKEKEIEELEKTVTELNAWKSPISCLADKFKAAGAALSEGIKIGGADVDNGRTAEIGQNFANIDADIDNCKGSINGKIGTLENEIEALKKEYDQALAAEQSAAAAETESRKSNSGALSSVSNRPIRGPILRTVDEW